jgi:hypothetical protein
MELIKNLFNKKKNNIDFDKIEIILREKESAIINCEYILMDIKPYRRNIFLQIYGKNNSFESEWKNFDYSFKLEWIKHKLLTRFTKDEFVEHIKKAILMFSSNEMVVKTFIMALEVDFEVVKNE